MDLYGDDVITVRHDRKWCRSFGNYRTSIMMMMMMVMVMVMIAPLAIYITDGWKAAEVEELILGRCKNTWDVSGFTNGEV
jgi:hypothetical protein